MNVTFLSNTVKLSTNLFPEIKGICKVFPTSAHMRGSVVLKICFFRFFFLKFNYAIYLSSPQGHLHCSFPAEVELRSPHLSDTEASISNYLRAGSISVLVSVGSRSLVLLHASSPNRHRTWTWSSSICEQRKTYYGDSVVGKHNYTMIEGINDTLILSTSLQTVLGSLQGCSLLGSYAPSRLSAGKPSWQVAQACNVAGSRQMSDFYP